MRPLHAELMRRSSPLPLIEISSTPRHPVEVEITGQALTWARCCLLVIMHALVDTTTALKVQLLNVLFFSVSKTCALKHCAVFHRVMQNKFSVASLYYFL